MMVGESGEMREEARKGRNEELRRKMEGTSEGREGESENGRKGGKDRSCG